jgi:peptide/nickel transport system permease protein
MSESGILPKEAPVASRRFWRTYLYSPAAAGGLIVLIALILLAVCAPWIAPQNPYDLAHLDILDSQLAPGQANVDHSLTYWLGTDDQGRDMLSAILYGMRISVMVGVVSTLVALVAGVVLGAIAGYRGGVIDGVIMRIADLQLSFPSILIALLLLALSGRGVSKIILALALVQWAFYARTMRSAVLVERKKDYIEAAYVLGLSNTRIVFRHLLPNCLSPLIIVAALQVASAISLEATLSFLGLGLPVTEPSLGLLIANGFQYMLSGRYWISLFPGFALLIIVMAINLVADRLRDMQNPRLQRR